MRPLAVLSATGTPEEIGNAHGSAFGPQIRTYMEERVRLSAEGTELDRVGITSLAERMLEHHRRYDADLFVEMEAMAEAAHISPAEALIVGGYTDFIDTVRAVAHGTAVEDTCTAAVTPDDGSGGAGFLAQTWDMHSSATPHVFILDVQAGKDPRALIFTTHGTLGQIGMNEAGLAVGINNLTMADGGYGVTWPFVVRRALREATVDAAIAAILEADLAGGHNFLLFDAAGDGASIEASRTASSVERLNGAALIHTNHCLAPQLAAVEADRPDELVRSSDLRLSHAAESLYADDEHTLESLMSMMRDERSICRRPAPPFDYESSGAMIMRPKTREMWACWGVPSDNEFEHFEVGAA